MTNTNNDFEAVDQIARIFFGKKSTFTIKPLGEGSNNVNYLVDGESKIVIKLSKPDFEYKAFSDYKKESWCLTKAHELDIPSPKVLKLGQHNGRAFLIESYIDGSPVALLDDSSTFSEEEKLKVWNKLGKYTKRINSVPVVGWGENLVGDGVFDGSWEKHIQYNIKSLNEDDILLQMEVLDKQLSKKIKQLFQSLCDKKFIFGLCHSDMALRNSMIGKDGEVYLLDWGSARAEIVPHYELNEILRASKPNEETLKAFLDGYGISQEQFEQMDLDLKILDLLNEIDTLRWAIDKRPSAIQEYIDRVKIAIIKL
ncbi:MAG: phosphotransferase [Candidatus Magasanikbacteria bacterium]